MMVKTKFIAGKFILLLVILISFCNIAQSQKRDPTVRYNVQIDGAKKFQRIDGLGVNANTASWNDGELRPALNLLIDSLQANVWRVIVETVYNWEDRNDNSDPFVFNWDYYNALYETPKFEKAWKMISYLNKRNIKDKLMINFMGPIPLWMGGKVVKPKYEDEYIEMLVSFFFYAKNVRNLEIGMVSIMNESDIENEGPTVNASQYVRLLKKFMQRMDSLGLGDIQYVAPDVAGLKNGVKDYIPALMGDAYVMSKINHFGLHSYYGYHEGIDSLLKNSDYPKSDFWMTEWNAWRDGLDDGQVGLYDYKFASECVSFLLDILNNGATSAMVWEGYDSYYEHHAPSEFSYWGILGYNAENHQYIPRKHFYALSQVYNFIKPGAHRISVSKPIDGLKTIAFMDSLNTMTLIGVNNLDHPIELEGVIQNIPGIVRCEMYYTNASEDLVKGKDLVISGQKFKTIVQPHSIFTITGYSLSDRNGTNSSSRHRPDPAGWYAGDIHVHRNCGDGTGTVDEHELLSMMIPNDLDVISVLADMGNGEVKFSKEDLIKVNGKDADVSQPGRIIHWDTEWHWDATYSNFANQALGGHLVLLGLKEAHQIWEESPYKVLEWGRKQNAVSGFAHMEYLNNEIQSDLNCCIPIDYPVEAALGTIDFVSEDVFGSKSPNNGNYYSNGLLSAYYRLLNCGFRIGLAAGTDYPCNGYEPLGTLLTYVNVKDKLTYRKWIDGIKNGKTVISRNGHNEFLDMKINGKYTPGDEIKMKSNGSVSVEVKWTAIEEFKGRIELVSNGKVVASQSGTVKPGDPVVLTTTLPFTKSGWICARRMDENGHETHTAPIYVVVGGKPIRASEEDAMFYVKWIDNLLDKTSPGQEWNKYFKNDLNEVQTRYKKASEIYLKIANEARENNRLP